MILHPVIDRSNLPPEMQLLSPSRQVLTNLQTRFGTGDRLECSSNAIRGIGLHVERIDMAWAAALVQEDDMFARATRLAIVAPLVA